MYYKKVPDNFSICTFGYENFNDRGAVSICKVLDELHRNYNYSYKSLKIKILKELYEDEEYIWYTSRTSDIFLTPRERKIMPMHNHFWISHYFKY